jgi:hypothetical protein
LALPQHPGTAARSLVAWQRDEAVLPLPRGRWPAPAQGVVRLQLWTLMLRADADGEAERLAEEAAIARTREQGLLVHPHMQGWAWLGAPGIHAQEVRR